MADRKVCMTVTTKMIIRVDEGQEIGDVIDEMDYSFTDTTGNAQIEDTEIIEYSILDSK